MAERARLRVGAVRGTKPAEETVEAGVPASALHLFSTQEEMTNALRAGTGNVRRSPSWSRLIVKYFGDQALQVLGK